MTDFKIKKGYNVPISGEAIREIRESDPPAFVGVCPVEFPGMKPKLSVRVDDEVKVGSPLYCDKSRPELQLLSPAAGRVTAINYGRRRVIEEIIVATAKSYAYEEFSRHELGAIAAMSRESLVEELLKGGSWPFIRQRPYDKIADFDLIPKSLFINCMDTSPLANDPAFSLKDRSEDFRAGVMAMGVLCDQVHAVTGTRGDDALFQGVDGVSYHRFEGKHPTGLVSTHMGKIDPIGKGDVVWWVHARDLVHIGHLLLKGRYSIERVVAVAGPGISDPHYIRTQMGVRINDLVTDQLKPGEQRFISGGILWGRAKSLENFLGFYNDLLTVLPEGREQHFLGWMAPGISMPSFTKAFLSAFLGSKRFDMNTNLNGGKRAIVQSGIYDRVVALDLYPEFLIKATIARDIDDMERLGILECAPEDFALCTYICPSKTEVSQIIAEGLELMEKEG